MPQISQLGEVYASQLFWLAIFFGAIFVVIGVGMLPKIQSTVDARDSKIAGDLAEAGKARETADRLEEEYRAAMDKSRADAAKLAADAKAAAAQATEARVTEADRSIEGRSQDALARIAESHRSALAEIEAVAAEATQAMVERVAGFAVDPAAARAAVSQELVHG
ncbi:ATPase [Sphingomonas ginkgonis]|uniref:ATP synthase subunit b n=1 Tax=Sphingomonas ginkgonis TaxID=2315330 RepID=A0A3S0EP10_9SPHN|nr:ATPase [Sphingomonas ginkgonis]RST31885.1 ATPase [Sphingomonas ginkgonis]